MKAVFKNSIFILAFLLLGSCHRVIYTSSYKMPPIKQNIINVPPDYKIFYDGLSPYGIWMDYPSYGLVWYPVEVPGFVPYLTAGNWVFTEFGWTWFSSFEWGWATFHYGRWFFDNKYGWIWVPGFDWAPAWVAWGYYNNFYCWAPVEPGVKIFEGYKNHINQWNFIHNKHLGKSNIQKHTVKNKSFSTKQITIVNNYNSYNNSTFSSGPRKDVVEKIIKKKIITVQLKDSEKPLLPNEIKNNFKKLNMIKKTNPADKSVVFYKPDISKKIDVKSFEIKNQPGRLDNIELVMPNEPQNEKTYENIKDKNVKKKDVLKKDVKNLNNEKPRQIDKKGPVRK